MAVFLGGGLGALARAGLGEWAPLASGDWPWATFVANLVAAFALGYLSTRLLERLPVTRLRRPLLGTGVCGGLSTFSTLQVEVVRLLQAGQYGVAVGYLVATLVCGLLLLHLGTHLARRSLSHATLMPWPARGGR